MEVYLTVALMPEHVSLSAEDPKFKIRCTHARTVSCQWSGSGPMGPYKIALWW